MRTNIYATKIVCIVQGIGLNRKVSPGEMHVYVTNVSLKLHHLTGVVHPKLICYSNLKYICDPGSQFIHKLEDE